MSQAMLIEHTSVRSWNGREIQRGGLKQGVVGGWYGKAEKKDHAASSLSSLTVWLQLTTIPADSRRTAGADPPIQTVHHKYHYLLCQKLFSYDAPQGIRPLFIFTQPDICSKLLWPDQCKSRQLMQEINAATIMWRSVLTPPDVLVSMYLWT